jgi:hypothetical protein
VNNNIDVRYGVLMSVRAGIAFFWTVTLTSKAHGSNVTDTERGRVTRAVINMVAALPLPVLLLLHVGGLSLLNTRAVYVGWE